MTNCGKYCFFNFFNFRSSTHKILTPGMCFHIINLAFISKNHPFALTFKSTFLASPTSSGIPSMQECRATEQIFVIVCTKQGFISSLLTQTVQDSIETTNTAISLANTVCLPVRIMEFPH